MLNALFLFNSLHLVESESQWNKCFDCAADKLKYKPNRLIKRIIILQAPFDTTEYILRCNNVAVSSFMKIVTIEK